MPEAATPNGGADGSARPQVRQQGQSQQSSTGQFAGNGGGEKPANVTDRLRASLFDSGEPDADEGRALPKRQAQAESGDDDASDQNRQASQQGEGQQKQQQTEPQQEADGQQQEAGTDEGGQEQGAQDEDQQGEYRSLNDLAEGLGWDLEKILDLETSTKIGGKDGKVRLRDLVKSHQLEGHLNQGLMKLAEDRKGFEGETARKVGEMQIRVGQLGQAVQLAQRILDGEFAGVNWQELQQTDPAGFQAKYGAYKMRLDGIQQLNQQVAQESERTKSQQQAAFEAYRKEQGTLLDSKIPEWSDKGKREKDVAELASTLNDAYGITEQELKNCVDHRQILLAMDAMRWQRLQKSKPATLKKVRTAPKLIRPGSQQSRATQEGLDTQKAAQNLRRTGRVQDATPLIKKLIFS